MIWKGRWGRENIDGAKQPDTESRNPVVHEKLHFGPFSYNLNNLNPEVFNQFLNL